MWLLLMNATTRRPEISCTALIASPWIVAWCVLSLVRVR